MDESGYHYDADALRALDDPRSTVFLTGKAGAGKSTLIRHWRSLHPNRNILTLAPTGIAALNVQGVTMHRFMHAGPSITPREGRGQGARTVRRPALPGVGRDRAGRGEHGARRMWETPATYGYLRPKDRDYITGNTNSQENRMQCIIQPNGENYLVWFDGTKCHPHPPRPGDRPPDGRQADPRPRTALLQARLQDRPMVHAPASGSRTGVRRPRPAL